MDPSSLLVKGCPRLRSRRLTRTALCELHVNHPDADSDAPHGCTNNLPVSVINDKHTVIPYTVDNDPSNESRSRDLPVRPHEANTLTSASDAASLKQAFAKACQHVAHPRGRAHCPSVRTIPSMDYRVSPTNTVFSRGNCAKNALVHWLFGEISAASTNGHTHLTTDTVR